MGRSIAVGGRRHARALIAAHGTLVGICVLVTLLPVGAGVRATAFVLTGLSTCVAMVVGPWLHRPDDLVTWRRLLAVCVLFAIGPAARVSVRDAEGVLVALPDLFLLPGYVIIVATMLRLLRLRGARDADALLDVAIVAVGSSLLSISYLVAPMVEQTDLPRWVALMTAVYPVLDVVVLALAVMLAFTVSNRLPSLHLILGAAVALLVGDLGYNLLARHGTLRGPALYDVPFLVAFGLLGASALHPSMVRLSSGRQQVVQAWSWQRLLVLGPALLVPALLILPDSDLPGWVRSIQALGTAVLILALLARAGRAVALQTRSRRAFELMSTHDTLTGLANRSAVNDRLADTMSLGRDVNVLFLDLDGFKMVNDSWGHAAGDELLRHVADRIRSCVPPQVLAARVGGDEFILVATRSDDDPDGVRLAEQLVQELGVAYQLTAGDAELTCSVGIATSLNAVQRTASDLIRDADTAMYRAKDAGRNRVVVFEPEMGELVRGRVELDRALRHALGRGELDVAYQPIVHLVTGRLLGFEALARWNRPDGGPSTPDVFIAAAEDNGLIIPIGDFVLGHALDQLARWRAASPSEISVSVNVSGRQLQDDEFTGRVLAAMARRGLPTSALRLEVTESTLVGDDGVGAQTMRDLERAGVLLSVDDFGTGYSSLASVSRLAVHEVKIDRTFVAGLTTRPEDHAIVRATAAMAQALGLDVVAEGIETREQSQSLVELGIVRGQGWWLGRPLPADRTVELLGQVWTPAVSPGRATPSVPRTPSG